MADFSISAAELKDFARQARNCAPIVNARLSRGVRAAGELVAKAASRKADFSKRIPASIKVTTRGPVAKITAGGEKAPNAAPIENEGKGFVRHPIFPRSGDRSEWTWTEKNSHGPFLHPALDENADAAAELIAGAADEAFLRVIH